MFACKQNVYGAYTKLVHGAENYFLQFFGLNVTSSLQPAEATTETKLGVNTTATTATIQTTSVGNLHQLH